MPKYHVTVTKQVEGPPGDDIEAEAWDTVSYTQGWTVLTTSREVHVLSKGGRGLLDALIDVVVDTDFDGAETLCVAVMPARPRGA